MRLLLQIAWPSYQMYTTYVIQSQKDGNRYIGLSRDPQQRLREHNSRRVSSTKSRVPFVLVYREEFNTLQEARNREKFFKSSVGRRFLDKELGKNKLHP